MDVLATLAAIIGRPLREGEGPDSVNMLAALLGEPDEPIRDHLVVSPRSKQHLALRSGDWVYISAPGGGGFGGKRIGEHLLGGPAAHALTKQVNSDILNDRLKPDAPSAQLYNMRSDLSQARNVILQNPEKAREMKARLQKLLTQSRTRANDR